VLRSAGQLLALSDLGIEEAEGRRQAEAAVASGSALEAYARWVEAQGGNPDEAVLPRAPVVRPVPAPVGGYVVRLHGLLIGQAAVHLGAGRMRKEDPVDHATGIVCLAKEGDRVEAGQALAEVHARDETSAVDAVAEVGACYELGLEPPEPRPLVLDVIA
jgi:thymidine phosphorylase